MNDDKDAIALHGDDHVATVLRPINEGDVVNVSSPNGMVQIIATEAIPIFHKIALRPLRNDSDILKHGDSIGTSISDIEAGAHVHVHNLRSKRALRRSR
ncbi:MAG: UxaA family hydrolase [Pseudomonadota bacterium]